MKCERCGFENPEGFAFCGKCGASLAAVCPNCGFENPAGFAFCGKCGASLTAREPEPGLTQSDLERLRPYLPTSLVEALQFDLVAPSPNLLERAVAHLSGLIKTTCTHLPPYLVARVVQDPQPGHADGQFIDGTLLFADISGFTAMSERLSRIGREGAEEITTIVNRYFSMMLSILQEHRGQLVKFGGDALLGLFLEPRSADHAVQAAYRMQESMSAFAETQTSQGVFPLRMKIGLHRGHFFAAQLGTEQGMEYALFGAHVNATAASESAAVAGQILVDPETAEHITLPCVTVPLDSTDEVQDAYLLVEQVEPILNPVASSSPLLDAYAATPEDLLRAVDVLDALTPYLPVGLLSRLVNDPQAISVQGEHRLVAVLFANVIGLGELADRLRVGEQTRIVRALNHYFVAIEKAIHRFGGVINKIDLYDHGDKVLAFFGAPLAHEDDAERAVRAALAMQKTLVEVNAELSDVIGFEDLKLEQKIGVSFGYVFAGYVGTDWRHEYTVMGDEVNLSARLMSAAEMNTIIVSSDVRRKVQAIFDFDPWGKVRLKGKSSLIPIFAVLGPRAIPEPVRGLKGMRSPLVGRDEAWDKLLTAMAQLLSGRGQIISVIGEAGLGKSRIVAEMRQRIREGSVHWIEGRCLSYTESVGYWPFQEIVRKLLGIRPDDTDGEMWRKLHAALDLADVEAARAAKSVWLEDPDVVLPYLANFLNLQVGGAAAEKIRYLDAEALQRRTFVAISTLLQICLKTDTAPFILVVDDIHWIDQASLALLDYLMPLVARLPLMFLLLYRPERAKACWEIHEKAAREFSHCVTEIVLEPLLPDASRQLLRNLVGGNHWPAEVYNLILDRTEGNPLYVEEIIRALIEDGTLVQDDQGGWQLQGEVSDIQVPDTLQGVLMTRLDRLEEPCRWTAQLASVVGRVFSFDVLTHIGAEDVQHLNHCLVRLQQQEIARETQRVPELMYIFKHALAQEVCYRTLLARTRRLYHRRIAAYLETGRSIGRREIETNVPLIAYHAFAGQDWSRALQYQLLAGQQAQKLFANHEAIEHLERALQSAEHLDEGEMMKQRQDVHMALGELLTTTGQYEKALEHLERACALAESQEDPLTQAHVCRWMARLYELRGEYPPALQWIEQGVALLDESEMFEVSNVGSVSAELSLMAGLIYTRQGDYANALVECQRCLGIAEKLNELTVSARTYNLLGHIMRLRGESTTAVEHFERAFDLYERAGDINGQALVHNQMANAFFDVSQWRDAEHHYRQARKIFERLGDIYHHAVTDNNLGDIALGQGRLDEAVTFYQEALQSLERIGGSAYVLGVLHMNLGHTFVLRDEVDTAYEHLRTSHAQFEQAQARDFLPELHRYFAEGALRVGELSEAETQARRAMDLARELTMRAEEGMALRILGEIAVVQGHMQEAEEELVKALTILEEVGDEYEAARVNMSLARLYIEQKNPALALTELERCTPVFEKLEARLDLKAARALRAEISTAVA